MTEPNGLSRIVGEDNVTSAPEALAAYAGDMSFAAPLAPRCVVRPRSAAEVAGIVSWANETKTPLVPVSSGPPRFRGDTVPGVEGAVVVDLSGLKKIMRIDRRNRLAFIEAGVTYAQLQPALAEEGLRLATPLLPKAGKSVIASLLEREPRLLPRYQWAILDPLRCTELIFGDGQRMTTGNAEAAGTLEEEWAVGQAQFMAAGPAQTDFYKLVSAAQGSMGIVTWASVKCEILPSVHKLYFAPAEKLEDLLDFVYKLLRLRFGDELLILNHTALAAIMPGADRRDLPRWVALVAIAGRDRLPGERVAYQEQDIAEMAGGCGLKLVPELPGVAGEEALRTLLDPSPEPYWKERYQDIFFVTTLDKTPVFTRKIADMVKEGGYPAGDTGMYLQPVHQGASCHCEFLLPFAREKDGETARMKDFYTKASRALLEQGAFYSRPYGIWADMAFGQDPATTAVLKKVKDIFDPNHIMNPGKLCF